MLYKIEKRLRKDFNLLLKLSQDRLFQMKYSSSKDNIIEKNNECFKRVFNSILHNKIYTSGPILDEAINFRPTDIANHTKEIERLRIKIRDIRAFKIYLEREKEKKSIHQKCIENIEHKKDSFADFENILFDDIKQFERAFEEYKQCFNSQENLEHLELNKHTSKKYDIFHEHTKTLNNIMNGLKCLSIKANHHIEKNIFEKEREPDLKELTLNLNKSLKRKKKVDKKDEIKLIQKGNHLYTYEKKSFISLVKSEVVSSLKRKENLKSKSEKIGEIIGESNFPDLKSLEQIVERFDYSKRINHSLKNQKEETYTDKQGNDKLKENSTGKKDCGVLISPIKREVFKPLAFIDEYSRREEFNKKNEKLKRSHEKLTLNDIEKAFKYNNFKTNASTEVLNPFSEDIKKNKYAYPVINSSLEDSKITSSRIINSKNNIILDSIPKEDRKRIDITPAYLELKFSEFKRFKEDVEKKNIRRSESTGQLMTSFIREEEIKDDNQNKYNIGIIHFKGLSDNLSNLLNKSPSEILKDLDKHKKPDIKYIRKSQELSIFKLTSEFPRIKNKITSPKSTYINYNYIENRRGLNDIIS